jgi:hypothetical protein
MADNGMNGHGGTFGFDDLPYFQDYLANVLRPRVERAIEKVNKSLTEAAWKQVIAEVASDQPEMTEMAAAMLKPLLEGKLGLKIEATLSSQFGVAKVAEPSMQVPSAMHPLPMIDLESDSGVMRAGGSAGADILTVRRRPVINPLANAVMNSRPLGR